MLVVLIHNFHLLRFKIATTVSGKGLNGKIHIIKIITPASYKAGANIFCSKKLFASRNKTARAWFHTYAVTMRTAKVRIVATSIKVTLYSTKNFFLLFCRQDLTLSKVFNYF